MKRLPFLLSALLPAVAAPGQESAKPGAGPKPGPGFHADFEDQKPGPVPSSYFVVDGTWSVAEIDGGRALRLAEVPIVDAQIQVGESLKDAGGTVSARVKADRKRRSYPRFGVGLHGMSGFRLRLVPVQNRLELVRNEEVVGSADLKWDSASWWHLELTVAPAAQGWSVTGRAWAAGSDRPAQPQIEAAADEAKFSGKASVFGTAFAGLPIYFDDLAVIRIDRPSPASPRG